jgi:hypothetical protein
MVQNFPDLDLDLLEDIVDFQAEFRQIIPVDIGFNEA